MRRLNLLALFVLAILLVSSCQPTETSDSPLGANRVEANATGADSEDEFPVQRNRWNEITAKEFLTISDLKKKKPATGIYETEGYIVDTEKCNCPPGMQCKCSPDSVTISEKNEVREVDELRPYELRILTDPEKFKTGQKLRFKIEIPESGSDDEPLTNVFFVGYKSD